MQAKPNIDDFENDFKALDNGDKVEFILHACHRLTTFVRTIYSSDANENFMVLRKINEIQHRLVSTALGLLSNETNPFRGNIFRYIVAGFDEIGAGSEIQAVISDFRRRRKPNGSPKDGN
jgi:hypothetical protein